MTDLGAQSYGVAARDGIVTPEGVVLEFVEAGLASRALAFILDLLIRVVGLIAMILLMVQARVSGTVAIVVYTIFVFAVVLVYPVAFEVVMRGRTPGKMALGLRVVTIEGGPVRLRHAAVRSGLGLIDFYVSSGAVAVLCSLFNQRSQRVGDVVAGTMVIRERSARKASTAVSFMAPYGWESFSAGLNTSGLSTELSVLVRDFLLRSQALNADARWSLGNQFAFRVGQQIGTPLPPGGQPEAYLLSVIAASQRSGFEPVAVPLRPRLQDRGVDDLSPTWGV